MLMPTLFHSLYRKCRPTKRTENNNTLLSSQASCNLVSVYLSSRKLTKLAQYF